MPWAWPPCGPQRLRGIAGLSAQVPRYSDSRLSTSSSLLPGWHIVAACRQRMGHIPGVPQLGYPSLVAQLIYGYPSRSMTRRTRSCWNFPTFKATWNGGWAELALNSVPHRGTAAAHRHGPQCLYTFGGYVPSPWEKVGEMSSYIIW